MYLQASVIGGAYEVLIGDAVQVDGSLQKLLKLGQMLRVMSFSQAIYIPRAHRSVSELTLSTNA